jgi:XTP/dITP diphosphohydrolase
MQIYVATSNPGKLRDFAHAAAQLSGAFRLEPLPGLKDIPAPPEDEPTFEGNARAKALYYAAHAPGELVLADDSGLEVDALHGAPGVRSARYADDLGFDLRSSRPTDERNNAALLYQLAASPRSDHRSARYRCVLALARIKDDPHSVTTAHGVLEGEILESPRGTAGFGYDPLFFVPEAGVTMAEIDPALRLAFSHRARALRNLLTLPFR